MVHLQKKKEVVIYTAAGTLALYKFTIYTAAGCRVKRFICTAAVDQVKIAIYTAAASSIKG